MRCGRQQLPNKRGFVPTTVFQIDHEPVEACESTGFCGQYRSQIYERADTRFVRPCAGAQ